MDRANQVLNKVNAGLGEAKQFFGKVYTKLFERTEEQIINDNISFSDETTFLAFLRSAPLTKQRLKFTIQHYFKTHNFLVRQLGPASMIAWQKEPEKRAITFQIGFTQDKERVLQCNWNSSFLEGHSFFHELMLDLCETFVQSLYFKSQETQPLPELTENILLVNDGGLEEVVPSIQEEDGSEQKLTGFSMPVTAELDVEELMGRYMNFDEEADRGMCACYLGELVNVVDLMDFFALYCEHENCSQNYSRVRNGARAEVTEEGFTTVLTITLEKNVGYNNLKIYYENEQGDFARPFLRGFIAYLGERGALKDQRLKFEPQNEDQWFVEEEPSESKVDDSPNYSDEEDEEDSDSDGSDFD